MGANVTQRCAAHASGKAEPPAMSTDSHGLSPPTNNH